MHELVPKKSHEICDKHTFRCNTTAIKCIKQTLVCDGSNDCGDWSDEPSSCNVNECEESHHCSQTCVDDLIGFHCECRSGFRLAADQRTCEDVNECTEVFGICSGHPCFNTKGHFKCQCLPGYDVSKDHKACRIRSSSDAFLLFSNRADIRQLSLTPHHVSTHQHYIGLYKDLKSVVAIDYSLRDNLVVWSDVVEEKILIAKLNASRESLIAKDRPAVLIHDDLNTVDGIAVDYIHNILYWTDTGKNTIEAATIRAGPVDRAVIVNSDLDEPRAIVLSIADSFIFWTDWGEKPKIERSLQDGSERRLIATDNMIWPNGLAIDHVTRRIYWTDAKLSTIEQADFEGTGRRVIFQSKAYIKHPFALGIFDDSIYWSDWELERIMRTNKFGSTGENSTSGAGVEVILGDLYSVMDVRVLHPSCQPESEARNRCENSACSHLCLPKGSNSFSCLCPSSYHLLSDGKTCAPDQSAVESEHHYHQSSTTAAHEIHTLESATSTPHHVHIHSSSSSTIEAERDDELEHEQEHGSAGSEHADENRTFHRSAASPVALGSKGHLMIGLTVILSIIASLMFLLSLIIYRNYKRSVESFLLVRGSF